MRPQCNYCGKFVSIGKGRTTEITVSKGMVDKGRPEKIYLCYKCTTSTNLLPERFKRIQKAYDYLKKVKGG